MKRFALSVLSLAALACAPGAAPAAASTAGVQGATLVVSGSGGERNRLALTVSSTSVRITDTGAPLRAGAGCTASGRTVLCPRAGLSELVLDAGDRDDRVSVGRSVTLRGRVRGGSGNDLLAGGGGPDELDGGTGRDTVSYASRADAVVVTLGGGADDGAPGEGDDLAGVEQVLGTAGFDVLTGGGASDRLEGRGGDDRLDGGAGNDLLVGGTGADAHGGGPGNDVLLSGAAPDGADVFSGGPGVDRVDYGPRAAGVVADPDGRPDDGERAGGALNAASLVPAIALLRSAEGDSVLPDVESVRGGRGDDVLAAGGTGGGRIEGLGGTDVLVGGPGVDRLEGGAGFDRLLARDGRADSLSCGSEVDRVFADASDAPPADCEATSRSFAVALAPLARTLSAAGALPVRVSCPAQAAVRCVGAVRAVTVRRFASPAGRRRAVVLGAARFNVPSGTTLDVAVAVGAAGRAVLQRAGGATRVRLAARGRDEAGPARPAAARLILRG